MRFSEMGRKCDKCGSSASLIFCWDVGRARECSATSQSLGAHGKTHMHSPVCDVCAVKPALIQCFSDGLSFCYTCFTGQNCVTSKDHLSVIPFSYHMICSDAPNQQQLSTFSSLPQLRVDPFSIASGSRGTPQIRPQQIERVNLLSDLFSRSSRGTQPWTLPRPRGTPRNQPHQNAPSSRGTLRNQPPQQVDTPDQIVSNQPQQQQVDQPPEQMDPATLELALFPLHPSKRQRRG